MPDSDRQPGLPIPDGIEFHERPHPSANSIVVRSGEEVALVDAGFVRAYSETRRIAAEALARGGRLTKLLLTHWHSDHSGGAGLLQREFRARVHEHRAEAELVNARHPEACDARWLHHPLPPYCVEEPLDDGSVIEIGALRLRTVHVPGQTPGHVAFFDEENRTLICGDMLQDGDVAWLPPMVDELAPLRQAIASVERLQRLRPAAVLPGHGAVIDDPPRAIDLALARYHRWLDEPELAAWHALNRLCVSALIIAPGTEIARTPWLSDYARVLDLEPHRLAEQLIDRLRRTGAIEGAGPAMTARIAFSTPDPLPPGPWLPADWPPVRP